MVGANGFMFVLPLLALVASTYSALTSTSSVGIATDNATDYLALLSFKSHMSTDTSQALESWGNRSIPMCQWRGVTCGGRGRRRDRVTALDLENLSLVGVISSSVANMTFLGRLHLPDNNLNGAVPSELGHLLYLKHLDLSGNSLDGVIPPLLSQCWHLENIRLGHNSLQGEIPHELGSLHNLKVLDLGRNNLTGTIPPEISKLANLENLNISYNMVTGEIPTGIGSLVELSMLSLASNQLIGPIPNSLESLSSLTLLVLHTNNLSGSIPTLQSLSSLRILELGMNDFSGCIPSQLGNLTSLVVLDLQMNRLTGGIPESIGNLNLLELLDLSNNKLTGSIPNSIGNLHFLTELDLDNNNLEGPLPPLFNLSNLVVLDVQYNYYLNGTLPLDMGNSLRNLQRLLTDFNQFHGPIPLSLCNASMLQWIEVPSNLFTGTIPSCLGIRLHSLNILNFARNQIQATKDDGWEFLASLTNCSHLQWLLLAHNKLGGEIPSSIGNLSKSLMYIDMKFNDITGNVPEEIANLVNLKGLVLDNNHLEGAIPRTLGELKELNILYIAMNGLSGSIPPTIGNLTKLSILHLHGNTLRGHIPSTLIGCPLQKLSLSDNSLVGPIPKELFLIDTLSDYLYIQNNALTGNLPIELGNLKNLGTLDFSNNQISGEIPDSLGECQTMQYLNASHNHFDGTIPVSVGQMKGLLMIDLSYNNLSGSFPEFLANMKGLSTLNLSFNNYKGEVPKDGIFSNASSVTLIGNDGLCGGVPKLKLPPCSSHNTKKLSLRIAVAISVGSTSLFVMLTMLLFLKWKKKAKSNLQTPTISEQQHTRVSYAELARATDSFSSEKLIGVGSFGSVFKGNIMINERQVTVAIKVLNLLQRGASQSFVAECETLRCARHRNLVKIITACSSMDYTGTDFKALIFEFFPNGNLEQWLHQPIEGDGEYNVLDLDRSLDISIDVASALEYLHLNKPLPIIHCDLKPSNILLDDGMVAHVGDFGLARFYHQDSDDDSWARMRGTTGYAAPEYGLGNEVSTNGDVYSYGILLLEIFTRKRPTDSEFSEDFNLHNYVRMAVPGQVANIVDQHLLQVTEDSEGKPSDCSRIRDTRLACITSVLCVGLSCSTKTPTERPKIGDALKELQAIRDRFRRDSIQGGCPRH